MSASVLIVAGHVGIENITAEGLCPDRDAVGLRGGTGTRGERDWTGDAAQRLGAELRGHGVEAVVTDSIYSAAVYARDYDLCWVLHLQRDRPDERAMIARPDPVLGTNGGISVEAGAWAQKIIDRFINEYPIVTGIPVTQDLVTNRMGQNYVWCYVRANTPSALVECGHADVDAAVLYEPGIARVVQALSLITREYLVADRGLTLAEPLPVPAPAQPVEAFPLASFPVAGVWDRDARALEAAVQSYSEGRAPIGWGQRCAELAAEIVIRADVAAAVAMHETGRFRFDGIDPIYSAKPEWNNYGGIKTTDSSATARFATMDAGLRALLAHLSWYANADHTAPWCDSAHDPRHFGPHRGSVHVVGDFGGGNWNAGSTYGPAVARHLAELRGRVAAWTPPAEPPADAKLARAKQLAQQIVDL